MALKTFKPVTNAQRQLVLVDRSGLHKGAPVKRLTHGQKRPGGRNNLGRITVRWQGGGHKQTYRIIDFKRGRHEEAAKVERLEYEDRKSTRLNSSHLVISYAVFCLKKKKKKT